METRNYDRRKLWSFFDPKRQKHRYILSLCLQYGWAKDHPVTGKRVADLGALDRWLKGRNQNVNSPVQKPLNDMDGTELTKVITALENMVENQ